MAQFLSGNRQSNLNLGITSSTENQTVLQVTGKVGIGTIDAQQYSLYVIGDTNIVGVSSLSGVLISSGIVTSSQTSGIVTYYGDGSNITGVFATSSVNVVGGIASVTSLNVSGISTLGITSVTNLTAQQLSVSGLSTFTGVSTHTASLFGTQASFTGVVTASTFNGQINSGVSTLGISTATNLTSQELNVTGISTLGTVKISSGIITATSGIVTYYGDGSNLTGLAVTAQNYVAFSGVSTNVVGGIASVTSLNVSGISTLGTVQVSSGIVTATTGVVTYYGDGSKLTGVVVTGTGFTVATQSNTATPVYPTLVSDVGVSTVNITKNKLSFIPSSGSLGLNTGSPRHTVDVIGSIGIQTSGSNNRFYLQHNPTLNSLDFIFV